MPEEPDVQTIRVDFTADGESDDRANGVTESGDPEDGSPAPRESSGSPAEENDDADTVGDDETGPEAATDGDEQGETPPVRPVVVPIRESDWRELATALDLDADAPAEEIGVRLAAEIRDVLREVE